MNTEIVSEAKRFPSWEELSRRDQLLSMYSDCYKDCYGSRPRMDLSHMSDDELEADLQRMSDSIGEQIAQDRIDQAKALRDTFKRMRDGAEQYGIHPFTYLRWLLEAELDGEVVTCPQNFGGIVGYRWGVNYTTAERLRKRLIRHMRGN